MKSYDKSVPNSVPFPKIYHKFTAMEKGKVVDISRTDGIIFKQIKYYLTMSSGEQGKKLNDGLKCKHNETTKSLLYYKGLPCTPVNKNIL